MAARKKKRGLVASDRISLINIICDAIRHLAWGLKSVVGQYELFTDQSTRDHLAWTIGNGDIIIIYFNAVLFHAATHDHNRPKYKGPFRMD